MTPGLVNPDTLQEARLKALEKGGRADHIVTKARFLGLDAVKRQKIEGRCNRFYERLYRQEWPDYRPMIRDEVAFLTRLMDENLTPIRKRAVLQKAAGARLPTSMRRALMDAQRVMREALAGRASYVR